MTTKAAAPIPAGVLLCPFSFTTHLMGIEPVGSVLAGAPTTVRPQTTNTYYPCMRESCAVWDAQRSACGLKAK